MQETYKTIWDPISADIPHQEYQSAVTSLIAYHQKRSRGLHIVFVICSILGIAIASIAVYVTSSWIALSFGFIPFFLYASYIIRMQNTLMLAFLCIKKGWIFAPGDDEKRAEALAVLLPVIFSQGYDSYVSNQIWGNLQQNNTVVTFWAALFTYSTGSGKSKTTTKEQLFIFRLPTFLPITLSLTREGFIKTGSHEVKTESKAFNDMYKIDVSEDDSSVKHKVVSLLSPSVQTRLIDFAHTYHNAYKIVFHNDMMILVFGQEMWRAQHSNLFLNQDISKKDTLRFETDLHTMAQLPSEMIQFID